MKCRYFCRLPLDISPVYLTRGISERKAFMRRFFLFHELTEFRLYIACEESIGDYGFCGNVRYR